MNNLRLLDNYIAILMPSFATPVMVYWIRQYIDAYVPNELLESARIDGANPVQMFMKITLPYMLFVTGPFLLTQFTGNLNNFNVIFLLTQGNPQSMKLAGGAGYTDLLVTWLYKMTVQDTDYKMAAVIGIMVFLVTAVISLVVYNILPSVKDEEGFQ